MANNPLDTLLESIYGGNPLTMGLLVPPPPPPPLLQRATAYYPSPPRSQGNSPPSLHRQVGVTERESENRSRSFASRSSRRSRDSGVRFYPQRQDVYVSPIRDAVNRSVIGEEVVYRDVSPPRRASPRIESPSYDASPVDRRIRAIRESPSERRARRMRERNSWE